MSLRNTIESLASDFAANVIAALRGVSIEELFALTGGGARAAAAPSRDPARSPARAQTQGRAAASVKKAPAARGKRVRRSAGDLSKVVDQIVSALAKSEKGLRSEQLSAALGVASKDLPRPLKEALASGRITRVGERRATTYFASSSPKKSSAKSRSK